MTRFNADDFGMTPAQVEHILDCRTQGCLTGVSAMPNAPYLPQAMERLSGDEALTVAVHLNFTEGLCLSKPETVPLLAQADGRFYPSFFRLFALSLGPRRRALKAQLKQEITAQIEAVRPLLGSRPLRLDGHQHVQMIPVVMSAIQEVVAERGYCVAYLRYSQEPVGPYLRHLSLWRDYKPVNWVKNLVLQVFSWWDRRYMRAMGLERNMVMGLVISGNLEYRLVRVLLPEFEKIAQRRGVDLELVMHPGWGMEPGQGLDVPGGIFEAFYADPGRKREYDCLKKL
jgi:predicted glycoside hydrolase/deacetylase ChbG (UPF0249 family)